MIAMVSQPMAGKTWQEIIETRERAICTLRESGYEVIDSLFAQWQDGFLNRNPRILNIPLNYLAESLQFMSRCDAVYFCGGWEGARGCRVEHEAAKSYGLKIIYEASEAKKWSEKLQRLL